MVIDIVVLILAFVVTFATFVASAFAAFVAPFVAFVLVALLINYTYRPSQPVKIIPLVKGLFNLCVAPHQQKFNQRQFMLLRILSVNYYQVHLLFRKMYLN